MPIHGIRHNRGQWLGANNRLLCMVKKWAAVMQLVLISFAIYYKMAGRAFVVAKDVLIMETVVF